MQEFDDFNNEKPARPQFLTVLCILTFIGSTFYVIKNAWNYSSAEQIVQMASFAKTSIEKDSIDHANDQSVRKENRKHLMFRRSIMLSIGKAMTVENIRKNAIGSMVSGIFTLLGAILMWNLKRTGFYIYILGILIDIAVPVILYGANIISSVLIFFAIFFGLLFITLYALNYKSLE